MPGPWQGSECPLVTPPWLGGEGGEAQPAHGSQPESHAALREVFYKPCSPGNCPPSRWDAVGTAAQGA